MEWVSNRGEVVYLQYQFLIGIVLVFLGGGVAIQTDTVSNPIGIAL